MANTLAIQVLEDGPRNTILRVQGDQNTSDLAYQVLIAPGSLGYMDQSRLMRATQLRINALEWDVQGAQYFQVRLWWDNSTPANSVRAWDMIGRSNKWFHDIGGISNTQATGFTGAIGISTQGWSQESSDCSFSVIVKLVKQYQGV